MALRQVIRRGLPDPAEVEHRSISEQLLSSPMFTPLRLFWFSLADLRPWWAVIVPVLVVIGLRTYRRERQQYLVERALYGQDEPYT